MRFGSLFSGIGGFDLGMERAGMACIWQVEIDPFCRRVLAKHWPHVERYEDVRHVGKHNLDPVDLICGGFPCQDVSVAGKRAGLAGERSGLWFEFHRIIAELKPRWVVIENVPGLLSGNGGHDFAVIIRGLVECGYGVAWRILDAQYFGVPQRRRRVFIVGSLGDGRSAEVLFESEGMSRNTPTSRKTGQTVTGTLAAGAHPGGFNGRDIESGLYAFSGKDYGADIARNVAPTLRAMGHAKSHANGGGQIAIFSGNNTAGPISIASALNARGGSGRMDFESETFVVDTRNVAISDEVTIPLQAKQSLNAAPLVFESRFARNGRGAPDTVAPPLKAQSGGTGKGDGAPLVFQSSQSGVHDADTHATLDSNNGSRRQNGVILSGSIRRLTPTESERLQGFPDGWTAGQPDSARYRQLGNAVAVPVIEWIGERLMEVL